MGIHAAGNHVLRIAHFHLYPPARGVGMQRAAASPPSTDSKGTQYVAG